MQIDFINPASLAQPKGYTHGVKARGASDLLFLGGQVAWDKDGRLVGENDIVAHKTTIRSEEHTSELQ